jgi:branched-chain amino acid transport system ATP-binding protein
LLKVNNIEVIYKEVILVLKGVSLEVGEETIVCLLGANGGGKSTTLKAISGLLKIEEGKVTDGNIEWNGQRIDKLNPRDIVRKGIIQVVEGRIVFEHLTVEENLASGGLLFSGQQNKKDLEKCYSYFPKLAEMKSRTSGYLSGGEQQMLVVGRALMGRPQLMLLDEPSLGLSPMMVQENFRIIKALQMVEKASILLVEQNARAALSIADYGYVMENGKIVLDGSSEKLKDNEDVKEFYLGLTSVGGEKSYRDVKHYKRRKRWL